MGSLGTGELVVIAVVALIVFGPKRLPELARKAGELLAKTREATKSVTSALDSEYDGITAPLQDLKREYDTTVKGFKDAASSVTGFSVDLTSSPPATAGTPAAAPLPTDAVPDAQAKPVPEADAEAEPVPEADAEADAEAEPEPVPEAEPVPDPEPEAESQPVADSEPAPPADRQDTGKQPENGA